MLSNQSRKCTRETRVPHCFLSPFLLFSPLVMIPLLIVFVFMYTFPPIQSPPKFHPFSSTFLKTMEGATLSGPVLFLLQNRAVRIADNICPRWAKSVWEIQLCCQHDSRECQHLLPTIFPWWVCYMVKVHTLASMLVVIYILTSYMKNVCLQISLQVITKYHVTACGNIRRSMYVSRSFIWIPSF